MKKNRNKNIFSTIFVIILLIVAVIIYRKYDFNFYTKGVENAGKTLFSRDSSVSYDDKRSYKIESKDYNDAMFYKEISVKKYTPYKVTCMIKTEDVEQYEDISIAGAQIVLKETEEHSSVIFGNTEWTKVEFCFNSKCNDTVTIGFRLGGNNIKAKGTAWFSDLHIEEGFQSTDTAWNFACFIFDNINVTLENGIIIDESLTNSEVYNLNDSMRRFKSTVSEISRNKMSAEYDVIEISDPITTLTYDKDNGYYVSEKDVYALINKYLLEEEYDHIFVCIKIPDEKYLTDEETTNWIGLGNMEYCGKGFSNIRVSDKDSKGVYTYSSRNTFPEEVYLHEFLHTLERNAKEYGFERPELHSYSKYNYEKNLTDGLRMWYKDYMNKEIMGEDGYIGLPGEVYGYTPVQLSDFEFSYEIEYLSEPKNPVETIQSVLSKITKLFTKKKVESQIVGTAI